MLLEFILLLIAALIIWTTIINLRIKLKNVPPGPLQLPILGTLVQFGIKIVQKKPPYYLFKEFSKVYGPLTGIQFGKSFEVVIDDLELMKEVLGSEVWSDRYFDIMYGVRSFDHPYGLLFSSGEEWKEMRRFTLRTFREFGFGKQSQEAVLKEELEELMKQLDAKIRDGKEADHGSKNTVVNMEQFFTISVLNILWSLMAGYRFSHEDKTLLKIQEVTSAVLRLFPIGVDIGNAFPSKTVRDLYIKYTKIGKIIEEFIDGTNQLFQSILEERRALGYYKEIQTDFIDVFLKEIDNHRSDGSVPNYYSDEQFLITVADLFLAGSETTSNTLEFAILYLILNPNIQTKIQEEIDRVIGSDRLPSFSIDKPQMPYTQATLMEIHRMSSVVPIDNRNCNKDTTLGGFFIPKGSVGILNIHSIHYNEILWGDPKVFRPERFLDSENNVINGHKLVAFGGGKRVCVGEAMARATLFTFLTAFLQKYSFAKVPGQNLSMEPRVGFTLVPVPYDVVLSYR